MISDGRMLGVVVRMQFLEKLGRTLHSVSGTRRMEDFERVLGSQKFHVQNGLYTLLAKCSDKGVRFFRKHQTVVTALDHKEGGRFRIHARNG